MTMIRQAQSYLTGAVSSAALVAAAIAAFVVLASAQAFRDWPVSGLGGADTPVVTQTVAPTDASGALTAGNRAITGGPGGGSARSGTRGGGNGPTSGSPTSTAQVSPGEGGSVPSGGTPTGGGGSPGGGGGPSGGSGGGNSPGSSTPGAGTSPVSGAATGVQNTVNNTVQTIDGATGGALTQSGVTQTVQGVTGTTIGGDTSVGQALNNTVGTVGDVLSPNP